MTGVLRLGCVIAGLAAAESLAVPQQSQSNVYRASAELVPVYATVIGADGRLVTDLPQSAFQVLDNGRPQDIKLFDNGLQPISIVVMLDTSGSMLGNLPLLRNAAVQMFTKLLPDDRARVGNFGDQITVSPEFTNDTNKLIRALWLELEAGGATPLWAAINVAMTTLSPVKGRRVVLVLSDGHDTGLWRHGVRTGPQLRDIVNRARADEFMIYAIGMRSRGASTLTGLTSRYTNDAPDPGLSTLAAESGGGYFELTGAEELGPVFARVADELHRQYLIGFSSPVDDGQVHAIEVRVSDPSMKVRARRSYVASKGSLPAPHVTVPEDR